MTTGPMASLELHLGPIPISALFSQALPSNWTQRNNHCLRRDFNVPVAERYTNKTSIKHLLAASNIGEFQSRLSGVGTAPPGPHTAGHLQIGMDMFDLFSSPNDPAFFFHHANVDRMWTIWQDRDLQSRQYALNGTVLNYDPVDRMWTIWQDRDLQSRQYALNGTVLNYDPPTAAIATLDTVENWGVLGKAKKMRQLMSNRRGDFNYIYADPA